MYSWHRKQYCLILFHVYNIKNKFLNIFVGITWNYFLVPHFLWDFINYMNYFNTSALILREKPLKEKKKRNFSNYWRLYLWFWQEFSFFWIMLPWFSSRISQTIFLEWVFKRFLYKHISRRHAGHEILIQVFIRSQDWKGLNNMSIHNIRWIFILRKFCSYKEFLSIIKYISDLYWSWTKCVCTNINLVKTSTYTYSSSARLISFFYVLTQSICEWI